MIDELVDLVLGEGLADVVVHPHAEGHQLVLASRVPGHAHDRHASLASGVLLLDLSNLQRRLDAIHPRKLDVLYVPRVGVVSATKLGQGVVCCVTYHEDEVKQASLIGWSTVKIVWERLSVEPERILA